MSKAFRAKAKAEKEIVGVSENICLFRSIERRVYGLQKRCIDGAFMKGPFPCQVLADVGLDPNNKNYPLAYALVEAESRAITDLLLNNNCEVFNSKIVGARDKATTTLLYLLEYGSQWKGSRTLRILGKSLLLVDYMEGSRLRKKRKRSKFANEPLVEDAKLSKKGRTISCQSCGNFGHNKSTCKGQGQAPRIGVNNAKASRSGTSQVSQVDAGVG
ncbi:hypothetical protein Tco_1414551 [Tanacetum coccineum]